MNSRREAQELINKIVLSIAAGLGCSCEVDIRKGYPSLYNQVELTDEVHSCMQEFVGKENVIEIEPWMASEDFAYYGRETNSCFYLLGSGFSNQTNHGLHTSKLNISESCLESSIGLMSYMAIRNLQLKNLI